METNKNKSKIKVVLFMLWPVLAAIIGVFIMFFAGGLDCGGNIFRAFSCIEWWGWVGVALVFIGFGKGAYWIGMGIKNSIK